MIAHRWPRSSSGLVSRTGRRTPKARPRRRQPRLELMESRELLSTIAEFPTPTANSAPFGITAGPDGNLWFTESGGFGVSNASAIGTINPTTHATTDFPTPTANARPFGITAGPDGNLWFTEQAAQKIGMINPTTHAITEFNIPAASGLATPTDITAGPDGNLWFTESWANKIGMINPTTHAITEFNVPTPYGNPQGIARGPDGNLWFTEHAGNIGAINPTTHAITEIAIPTANTEVSSITAGPDGNLWFTETAASKIASISPTSHAITETALPAGSYPFGITAGPDGNLWFVESASAIGLINPTTHAITDFPTPTANGSPYGPFGITAGPDGNLWFTEQAASKIGVVTPSLNLAITSQPPAFIAPNAPFALTVNVNYQSGGPDTGFSGPVTVALVNPNLNGAVLGGALTTTAHNGVATFSGLTMNQVGAGYRVMAFTDPLTTAITAPVTVVGPPSIVAEKPVFSIIRGRRRRLVGVKVDFSTAMDETRANTAAEYMLTQNVRRGRTVLRTPVNFAPAYNPTTNAVTLTLLGRNATFAQGGQLVVIGASPTGLTSATGVPLDAAGNGVSGSNGTFTIGSNGATIKRRNRISRSQSFPPVEGSSRRGP